MTPPAAGRASPRSLAIDPAAPAPSSSSGAWRTWGELGATVDAVAALVARPGAEVGILLRNRPASVGAAARRAARRRLRRHDQPRARASSAPATTSPRSTSPSSSASADDLATLVARRSARDDRSPSTTSASRSSVEPVDARRRRRAGATRASRCGCSRAARPGRRSGSTSPTTTLERVLVGAKHYESNQRPSCRLRDGRRHRQLAARAPRRPLPGAAVRERRPVASRCSSGSRSTPGSTPCAATGRRPPASCPPRCAWCSRPTSIPPTSPASGRSCPAPRRSTPTTPTPSPRSTACRCSSPTPPPSSAAASRVGTSPTTSSSGRRSGAASGRAHPGCELRVVDADDGRAVLVPTRRACSR